MIEVTADNLPRIMVCRGSIVMEPAYPPVETDQTTRDEGIAADFMANSVFRNEFTLEEMIDRKAPNGVYMSDEMANYVGEYLSALDCGDVQVDTSFTNPGYWRIGARCDHRKWDATTGTLTIDDLKYGHRIVEPEMHWTLIAHAIGSCLQLQIAPTVIVLRIHQPRPYHPDGKVREWRLDYTRLMELYATINARLCDTSTELYARPDTCYKCNAIAHCPAARKANMNSIDAAESFAFSDKMTGEQLATELQKSEAASAMLKNRTDAIKELMLHRIKGGEVMGDYAREPQYANTAWNAGLTPELVGAMTGVNVTKSGFVTPAEAKRRGMDEATYSALTNRPMIGHKLTRVNPDKRAKRLLNKD